MAQGSVHAIAQDHEGLIWIGTQDGLHRHDGHRFQVYRPDPGDPASLSHSMIWALLVDEKGQLWVGTFGGLDRLIPETGQVEHFAPRDASGRGPHITALAEDGSGSLWIGTRAEGLFRLDPESGAVTAFPLDAEIWALESSEAPTAGSTVWIGTSQAGVLRLDPGAEEPLPVTSPSPRGTVRALTLDRTGALWAGTDDGRLLRLAHPEDLDAAFESVERCPPLAPIWDLLEDRRGDLWIATRGDGLLRFDPSREVLRHDAPVAGDPWSLHHDAILSLFEAHDGTLWAGTAFEGVAIANPTPVLRHITAGSGPVDLPHPVVRSLAADPSGGLWVGTHGAGLVHKPPEEGVFTERYPASSGGLPNGVVWAIHPLEEGGAWVGTDAGLSRITTHGSIESWSHDPSAAEGLGPGSVRAIELAHDGGVWIGLFGGGLDHFDPIANRWTSYRPDPTDPASLPSEIVFALKRVAGQGLWIGTGDGLAHLDEITREFRHFARDSANPHNLSGRLVRSLHIDPKGTLWIGTDAGLHRLDDPRSGDFQRIPGLPNNTIYGILGDEDAHIWVSTNRGLARLDPDTLEVLAFDPMDGLQGFEFNGGAATRDRDGVLWFGGVAGLNAVQPGALEGTHRTPELRITGVSRGGVRVSRPSDDHIDIPAGASVISLELAVLDYLQPRANRYAWRMPDSSPEWVDLGSQSVVTFAELAPRRWRLEVRGAGHDGSWSSPKAILLDVHAPAWKTPTARVGYGLVLLATIGLVTIMIRRRRSRERNFTAALRRSEERLQLALVGGGDGLWDWNLATDETERHFMAELLGWSDDEDLPKDDDFRRALIHPEDLPGVESEIEATLSGHNDDFEAEYRMKDRSGRWRWILDRGRIVERDAEGRPLRMAGTCKDISRRRAMEDELRLWSAVFRSITDGVLITDAAGRILAVNAAFSNMTGWRAEELEGQPVSRLQPEEDQRDLFSRIGRALRADGQWRGEAWHPIRDGGRFLASIDVTTGTRPGAPPHYVAVVTDITGRRQSEEQLRFLASYDALTGLPNRTLFHDRLDHALAHGRRRNLGVALLFADLDRFKDINDSLGHAVGDLLLQRAAARLGEAVREDDTVARFGGDEFTIVLEEVLHRGEVVQVAERVLQAFAHPFHLEGNTISVTPSLGISLFPQDGEDGESLLKHADTAMYQAKRHGRGRFQFYDAEMTTQAVRQLTLENQLRGALEREELLLHYQPRVRISDGQVLGAEALMRWQPGDGDLRFPSEFLPTLVETGLIVPAGALVLRQACCEAASWEGDRKTMVIAVNVSARQLTDPGLETVVRLALEESGLPAERLLLEVTESELVERGETGVERLVQLAALGVRIAIDDFGTGYSSLGYLKLLPVDELKIDRSLVHDLGRRQEDRAILAAIVAMADALGLDVVAEGVETALQAEALAKMGCPLAQGFYYSRPLPATEWRRLPARLGAAP